MVTFMYAHTIAIQAEKAANGMPCYTDEPSRHRKQFTRLFDKPPFTKTPILVSIALPRTCASLTNSNGACSGYKDRKRH